MSQTGFQQHLRKHHTTSYFPQGRRKQSGYFPLFIAQWLLLFGTVLLTVSVRNAKLKTLPRVFLEVVWMNTEYIKVRTERQEIGSTF